MSIDRATDLGERKVFEGAEADAALVKMALDQDGVRAETWWTRGRGPHRGAIYVVEAKDVARAKVIVARYVKGATSSAEVLGAVWMCPVCGERVEPQFAVCWKCGHARNART